jgi:O-antigen/teichoic acid export membrane protein
MSTRKIITRNVLWNCSGLGARLGVGFFIAPFLLHGLGDSTYGLWIVIGSLTSYFGVLDLGVRGSIGRNVALHRARGDLAGINAIFSTAFCYLCAVAVLSLAVTVGAMFLFFWIIQVEPEQLHFARLALLLVGLNFALCLPLQAFDGILWAYQRFDLQNGVDIPTVLLRAGLTYYFIAAGHGLVALAIITLVTSLACLAAKVMLALRLEPNLRIGWTRIDRAATKGLFGYGVWYFLLSLVRTIAPPVFLLIVGSRLGMALVAPFNVATGLLSYANQFLIAGTQVLTPVATAMHARDDQERQRALFLTGGRGCLALSLLLVSLFVFLGKPLIRLWMGPSMEHAYLLLLILSAGELLPMSQWITYSMILGKGRHRILAISSVLEITTSAVAALLLTASDGGLVSVCLALAIPAALARGVCPMVFGCGLVGLSPASYLAQAVLPPLLAAAGPVLLLGLATTWWTPATWPAVILCGGGYTIFYLSVTGIGLFGVEVWRDFARRMISRQGDHEWAPDAGRESATPKQPPSLDGPVRVAVSGVGCIDP